MIFNLSRISLKISISLNFDFVRLEKTVGYENYCSNNLDPCFNFQQKYKTRPRCLLLSVLAIQLPINIIAFVMNFWDLNNIAD